jgi:hypothetical protein
MPLAHHIKGRVSPDCLYQATASDLTGPGCHEEVSELWVKKIQCMRPDGEFCNTSQILLFTDFLA